MRDTKFAALLLAALVSAGCSSSNNANSSTSASSSAGSTTASTAAASTAAVVPSACSVLTNALAKQLIGPTAKQTMNVKTNAHTTHCHYNSDDASVDLMLGDDWGFVASGRENGIGHKKVAGIGDEAYEDSTGLYARKGTMAVEVDATGADGSYSGAAADAETTYATKLQEKAAKLIVNRL